MSAAPLVIMLSPGSRRVLVRLVRTGLFGRNLERCAEELIREKLRELEVAGWTARRRGKPKKKVETPER